MSTVLVVDAANVVGSRPDGWWRDRAGAAARLHDRLLVADLPFEEVVLVLEGRAKAAMAPGRDGDVLVVHAAGEGDETIVAQARAAAARGARVTVVTADRFLRARAEGVGATTLGPGWLWDHLA